MHAITRALAAVGMALVTGIALAQDSAILPEVDSSRCSADNRADCLNGVGSGVTSLDGLRVSGAPAARRGGGGASDEQREAMLNGGRVTGMSAGSGLLEGYSVWTGYGHSRYESTTRLGAYEGRTDALQIGVDRFWGDRFLVGVSAAYETTDNDTTFNDGEQDADGFLFAPYAVYLLNDAFSIDASVGYGRIDTDQDRINTGTGSRISSDFESERAFGSINLNGVVVTGEWVFGGRVGMLHAVESQDGYTERDTTAGAGSQARTVGDRHVDLTQGYVSFDAAYSLGGFEPYALIGFRRDFSRDDGRTAGGLPGGVVTQPDDRTEWEYGLGLRYFGDGVSGSLEWITTQGREQFDN
ncbi:MAG: autotransporter outer membrane beta-barrel domain-containing protein, partial [Planctomycetes bacterium]|nr:autotransporter outer membrane beta-barrel domain-containing protein [Planctomycetota bacterium]